MNFKRKIYDIIFGVPGAEGWRYKRSMDLFIVEAIAGNAMTVLTGGAFLSGYALLLGASDYLSGLILSLPLLTNIFQILLAIVYERMQSRKKLLWILQFFYRSIMCATILIPLVFPQKWWVTAIFAMAFFAYASLSALAPGNNVWFVSLIPESIRGHYMSKRESMFQASAMIVSLLMGKMLDMMGRGYHGFVVVFGTAAVFSIIELIMLAKIEEPPIEAEALHRVSMKELLTVPLGNRSFMNFFIFWVSWVFSLWLGNSFFSVYMIKYLNLSYTYITALSTISLLIYIIMVRVWGKKGDKTSWDKGLKTACSILAVTFFLWSITDKHRLFLLPIVHILSGISWSGINISSFNTLIKVSPQKGKTIYLGFNAAFTGIAGFLGPVVGGWLLDKPIAFLPSFSGIQITFLVSAVAQTITLLYGFKILHLSDDKRDVSNNKKIATQQQKTASS